MAGDLLRVLEGERIPADGRVRRGLAFVDEQVLTGESAPAPVRRATRSSAARSTSTATFSSRSPRPVPRRRSHGSSSWSGRRVRPRERYERLADRVSAWFVPCVTLVAVATFVTHGVWSGWERGLLQGLAVVLIACPCALGLATPLAVWSALGRAAGRQVLFRSGDALERLALVRAVRFDKTGTLTTGAPAAQQPRM